MPPCCYHGYSLSDRRSHGKDQHIGGRQAVRDIPLREEYKENRKKHKKIKRKKNKKKNKKRKKCKT
jgi:beta-lactamase superfamily II metal-dependent hydrolase